MMTDHSKIYTTRLAGYIKMGVFSETLVYMILCAGLFKILCAGLFEPRHEISNNVVCGTSKASDQPAHMRSLIRVFAIVACIFFEC